MKKIIYLLLMLFIFISITSCSSENNKEKTLPPYTAKEQLDYINENLFFMEDYIKLGKSIPEIQTRDDYHEHVTLEEESNLGYSGIILKNNSEFNLSKVYCSDSSNKDSFNKYNYLTLDFLIEFNGEINKIMGDEFIATRLHSSVDNFSFFDVRLGENLGPIKDKLEERGFECPEVVSTSNWFTYGCIKIVIRSDSGGYIKYINLSIERHSEYYNYINTHPDNYLFEKYSILCNKDDILKYFMPLEFKGNYIIFIDLKHYMDDFTTEVNMIEFYSKTIGENANEWIEISRVQLYESDNFISDIYNKINNLRQRYYVNREYHGTDEELKIQNIISYFSNNKLEDVDIIIRENLTLHNNFQITGDFSGIANEYLYIKNSIESIPGYDEYIKYWNEKA